MNADILRKLICPNCGSPRLSNKLLSVTEIHHKAESSPLECDACRSVYPLHEGIIDLAGAIPIPSRPSQWAMEFKPLILLYERIWRPMVTMPFSDLNWEIDTVQRIFEPACGFDVLDLACGPGNFTRRLAQTVNPGVVIGFDLSLPMLKQGAGVLEKENTSNIVLMRGDVTRWPFAPGSFDRVHCSGALHLFPKLARVFASIHNTLQPGGVFVGATYCRGGGLIKRRIQNYISNAYGFHWFELQELQSLTEAAGFVGWQHFIRKQGIVFRVNKPKMAA
jgi:SAM-dependent methyltransferase